ncbi:MAG: TIM barrel protein [Deltaproteobacteria bacterium]|nr:TIM barrel protein [Deltaproteobacteria bacterium]
MNNEVKFALITGFVSKTKDRFHEYNEEKSLAERLEMVSQMEGMSGAEVVFPYEVNDAASLKSLLIKYNLGIAAVNVNVKAEPEFRNGGLTSTDPAVRRNAVRFIRNAKDFAQSVGADKVTCCPLGDGYEFAFQCDYAQMWRFLIETFGEAGAYKPEIPLFIEYKPSETRGHCLVDTAAKALCLLSDIGIKEMGITMDYGHSKYGQENPAEVVALLAKSRFPYYIHINDNNGRWDWDFMVASHNFLEYVEFIYYVQEYGYSDFLTSDTSPTRWDIRGTFEANARMTRKIWDRLNGLDRMEFAGLIRGGDFLKTWKFVEANIFKL